LAELQIGRLTVRINFDRKTPAKEYDSRRTIGVSFAASMLLHVLGLPLLVGLLALPFLPMLAEHKAPQEIVTISSAVRLEKRTKPVPARPVQQPRMQPVKQTQPVRAQRERVVAQPRPVQREVAALSRPDANAKVHYASKRQEPEKSSTLDAKALEQQQEAFEKTIAQARNESDPVLAAARPVAAPAAEKRYAMNIAGAQGPLRFGEGFLIPLRHWSDGPYVYYYVRYSVVYPDGSTEQGTVPWPIHYLAGDDPFARGLRHMPLPGPTSDYTANTTEMQPLVKNCYDHRYTYCPIERESSAG
jgi:hypothetical protein